MEAVTERTVMIPDILPGSESEGLLIEPLMEYHEYVMRVAASTDKGFGDYSEPLNVLTDEHGKCGIHDKPSIKKKTLVKPFDKMGGLINSKFQDISHKCNTLLLD